MSEEQTYLAFVWSPAGYVLREEHGQLPHVGETVESDGKRWTVLKIGLMSSCALPRSSACVGPQLLA